MEKNHDLISDEIKTILMQGGYDNYTKLNDMRGGINQRRHPDLGKYLNKSPDLDMYMLKYIEKPGYGTVDPTITQEEGVSYSIKQLLEFSKKFSGNPAAYFENWKKFNDGISDNLIVAYGESICVVIKEIGTPSYNLKELKIDGQEGIKIGLYHGTFKERDVLLPRDPNWFKDVNPPNLNNRTNALAATKDAMLSVALFNTKKIDKVGYKILYRIIPSEPVLFYKKRSGTKETDIIGIECTTTTGFSSKEFI